MSIPLIGNGRRSSTAGAIRMDEIGNGRRSSAAGAVGPDETKRQGGRTMRPPCHIMCVRTYSALSAGLITSSVKLPESMSCLAVAWIIAGVRALTAASYSLM